MAEVYLRYFHGDQWVVKSAGIEKHGLNPFALGVLIEDGMEVGALKSKTISEVVGNFDVVFTVCDHAHEHCPVLPGVPLQLHHNFQDPSKMHGSAADILQAFRKTRDDIKSYCRMMNL